MCVEWLRSSPCYVAKCIFLLHLISRRTGAECSVDGHGSGMNYPTTTASGTWTTRGGISSYGWDSQQPIDPCSRCSSRPHPLPGSQYTTGLHGSGYNSNDRVSNVVPDNRDNVYNTDTRGSSYNTGNSGYPSHMDNRYNGYNTNNNYVDSYSPSGHGTGYNMGSSGNSYSAHTSNYNMNSHGSNYMTNTFNKNPDYRGNGYDNMSPEWEKKYGNRKPGYNQGMAYPVTVQQGGPIQGGYGSNDRWDMKGVYPAQTNSGYWHSQPPKDIGWDEDSKKVGVIAGWMGGPNKYESGKPAQLYNNYPTNDKDDDYFNKGTGYENSDKKRPFMGWGGSGSYEVIKMNNGYKYVDRNGNGDYGVQSYGNNYGYGGVNYNNKPVTGFNSKPDRPYDYGYRPSTTDRPTQNYDVSINNKPTYSLKPTDWSTSRPISFDVTSRPSWNSQRPNYSGTSSRPSQNWGDNSFNNMPSTGLGYDQYGNSRPLNNRPDHGSSGPRPDYGSQGFRPDYGSSGPRPDYGSSGPRPDYGSLGSRPEYVSYRPETNKYGSYDYGRPQNMMNNRPGNDNDRPYTNDNYGSSQMGSGYGKGYASNWDYYSNSMRGPQNGWNDPPREYLQRRPDGDILQSGSNQKPSESTPIHYNGHSGIGASTDNGFSYRTPSTIISSTTPLPTTIS
ncbi:probable serine/threonine-protein kinase clkA isoform X2 [Adelges cooleyi]|uniref:probable serine/threonine-protein kinase clkA isoform X2 n=1 Tax=Adelges cooleyi TaxID=133065 RepID=UPI00217FFB80|nr:probable serine/threonine-protein kinase clkA isoform X2 [Adelges cooleyi]